MDGSVSPRSRGTISSIFTKRKTEGSVREGKTSPRREIPSDWSPRREETPPKKSPELPARRRSNKSPEASPRKSKTQLPSFAAGPRVVGKSGWLRKKMQKRFFVIVEGWLFWFKEQVDTTTNDWTATIQSSKGGLFVSRCNVAKGEKPKEFVIVNPEGSNYLIAAESEEERDSWVRAIQKVVQVEDSIETGLIEKRGILKFRNIPKFFVLKEGVLMWFASENDATLEGSTTLMSATIALGQTLDGGPAFVIATLETKFVIGCESRGEAEDWAAQIKASINASKAKNLAKIQDEEANIFTNDQVPHFEGELAMMGVDNKFSFVLQGSVIQWYSEKTNLSDLKQVKRNIRGYISLQLNMRLNALPALPETSNQFVHGFVLAGPGKSVAFLAASERERSEWIKQIEASLQWFRDQSQKVLTRVKREEKEGFLLRGKLKIWAVVKVGSFMMYDSKSSKKAITTLQLGNCGLLETKGKEGFLIFTTVPSLEVLQCSGRKNEGCEEKEKEKTNFSAQILAQAECCEWFQAVLLNIVRANNAATEKEAKNKVEAPGIAFQSVRLSGNGEISSSFKSSSVFFSIRHSSIVWYKSEQSPIIKGSLQLCGCQADFQEREGRVSIYGSDEKLALEFTVQDKNAHWGVALQEAIFEADEERGYKKFGYLETKQKRKWVVVTRRFLLWFPFPMKVSDIQNAGAFDCVQLSDCDLTAFGTCGFVLSERKTNSKVGEKVTVVSFLANSEAECREWMQILEQFVIQRIPRKHVAFPFFAMRVPCVDGSLIPLDGLGMSAGAEFALLKLPQSVSLFDGESPISCGSSVKQLACYCNWRKPFVDSLCFRAATETVMSENEVRLDVRQPMATATFWQTCKKECKNGVWIDVFEDQQATSPEVLLAKWDLKEMLLDVKSDFELVRSLLSCLPTTEQDSVVQSIIALCSMEGCALHMIERFVVAEIDASSSYETLFRTNSNATKMCKFFSMLAGAPYLQASIQGVVQRMFDEKLDCEIDGNKVSDPSLVQKNLKTLVDYCRMTLDAIVSSLDHLPDSLRFICVVLWCNVEKKFGDFKFAALGGFFFLRFLCPALLTPDSHGLIGSSSVSKEFRRTLTLLAKALQNISNGVEFGAKEEFMIPLNPFIREQIPVLRQFFSRIVSGFEGLTAIECESPSPLSISSIDRSMELVYKQILFQQRKLGTNHPEVAKKLEPLIKIIGIPEKLARTLEKQRTSILL